MLTGRSPAVAVSRIAVEPASRSSGFTGFGWFTPEGSALAD